MFLTSSFLQIPSHDGHPTCFRLYPSHYRIVYAPISRLRRSFAGIRKMPTSKAIKKETCKQACSLFFYRLDWRFIHCFRVYYSMIVATRPDPTVRPPSRIAKVRPWLIAIGWISSIVISMLSPGIHISVPSGRLQTPVTSVVLK